MPVFAYEALNDTGKVIRGIIDAESARTARSKLRDQGIHPTEIHEEGSSGRRRFPALALFGRVRAKDLALSFRQLATLLEAGIPLTSSISAMIGQMAHPALKKVLTQIRENVREGAGFADALSLHPMVFPALFIGLVRAGETSGTLTETLSRWADFSEHQVGQRQKIQAALIYPIFMFIIGGGVLLFLMAFVVPTVTRIFADLGQALPLPTRILIGLSNFLERFWWGVAGGGIALFLWLRRFLRSERGARFWDRLKIRLPLVGQLQRKISISRWCRTLGTLLDGGLPLIQAWETTQGVVGSHVFAEALNGAREKIREGEEIATSLRQSNLFPSVVLEMIAVGERSGQIGRMLQKAAAILEGEVEADLRGMMALLEPVMILVMGIGVGFIAVSILLPILEMSQIVR